MDDIKVVGLLEDVKAIIAADMEERIKSGKNFNVFKVTDISTDEVKVCRVLREILDPLGSHGQGSVFLRLFMEKVLEICDIDDSKYDDARVAREEHTDKNRRIDLVIYIADRVIPIEVKIYAGDQYEQCCDYYKYAQYSVVYYLTPDGHEPSDASKGGLNQDEYTCLSFEYDIDRWLTDCIDAPEIKGIGPIREILIQFRDALNALTGKEGDDVKMSINELIQSRENFAAALEIANALPDVKANMMKKVFDDIHEHIRTTRPDIQLVSDDTSNKSRDYYLKNRYSSPSLNYRIPPVSGDIDISDMVVFRIEAGQRLYLGVSTWNSVNGTNYIDAFKTDEAADYIKKYLMPSGVVESDKNKYWYWWSYISKSKGLDQLIDFRYYNEAYKDLYDPVAYKRIMKDMFEVIDAAIETIYAKTKKMQTCEKAGAI